jgi:YHS domain-containing protein
MINIIRLAVLVLVFYLLYKLWKGIFLTRETPKNNPAVTGQPERGEELIEDPFCHRYIPASQAYRSTVDGQAMFFCSEECCEHYKSEKGFTYKQGAS